MPFPSNNNNLPIFKFESMLKTNSIFFFDSVEFEEIIHYYLDEGKNALAKKAINLGLKQHPNSVNLKLLLAELLIFEDSIEKASVLLREIQLIEPNNEEVYIQQAAISSKAHNHVDAIELLKIALELTEDKGDVFSMIGMEYLYLDNFNEARNSFEKCIDINNEDYASLYNVVYCFDMENKHKEAIEYLTKFIDEDPFSEVAWHQLGRQYYILNNFEEALRAFDYSVVVDEFFVGGYLEKAKTLEELKRYKEAIENYKKTLELDDPTSFVYLRIGDCYEKLKKNSLAIQYYKKAVHEDPILEKGWIAITNLYSKQKKFNKALFFVNKALEIDPYNPLYWRSYAEINLNLNFFEEAVVAFEECIKLQDLDLIIWLGLADVNCFLGEFDDALKSLIQASKHFRNCAEIEFRLAGLYFLFNNQLKGEKHLKKGLKIDSEYLNIIKDLFPTVFTTTYVTGITNRFNKTSQ